MREINEANLSRLPEDMKLSYRWMVFTVKADGRKMPYSVDGTVLGSSTDPSKWGSLCRAISTIEREKRNGGREFGLAFVLGGGWCGLDLDHVIDDGAICDEAAEVMEVVGDSGYAETSVSGDGIHVIFQCDKPEGYVCKKSLGDGKELELYGKGRYFTVSLDSERWGVRDHFTSPKGVVTVLCDRWLKKGKAKAKSAVVAPTRTTKEQLERYVDGIVRNTNWGEGNRNHAIFKAAGNIANKVGDDESEIYRWVSWINSRYCSPPLEEFEVMQAVRSALRNGTKPVETPFVPKPTVQPVAVLEDEQETLLDIEASGINLFIPKYNLNRFHKYLLEEEQGFLGCVVRDLHERNNGGTKELDIATALVTLGTITAGKVKSSLEHTTPPTMMVVALAPTGQGKEHGLNYTEKVLEAVGLGNRIGPDSISSGEGIGSAVRDNPKLCFLLDEFADSLGDSRGKSNAFVASIKKNLKTSFTKGHKTWRPVARSDAKLNYEVKEGLPSYYMATTPESFWDAFRSDGIKCGLLGRMMIFRCNYTKVTESRDEWIARKLAAKKAGKSAKMGDVRVDEEVLEHARQWHGDTMDQQILSSIGITAGGESSCDIWEYTDEAAIEYHGHHYDIEARSAELNDVETKIWKRAMEKVSRVSLLLAISEKGKNSDKLIEKHHVEWAWKLVHAEVKLTFSSVIHELSETDDARIRKDLLAGFEKKSCKSGLTIGMFNNRGIKWDNSYAFKNALAQLVEEGRVKTFSSSRGNVKYIHRKYWKPEMGESAPE